MGRGIVDQILDNLTTLGDKKKAGLDEEMRRHLAFFREEFQSKEGKGAQILAEQAAVASSSTKESKRVKKQKFKTYDPIALAKAKILDNQENMAGQSNIVVHEEPASVSKNVDDDMNRKRKSLEDVDGLKRLSAASDSGKRPCVQTAEETNLKTADDFRKECEGKTVKIMRKELAALGIPLKGLKYKKEYIQRLATALADKANAEIAQEELNKEEQAEEEDDEEQQEQELEHDAPVPAEEKEEEKQQKQEQVEELQQAPASPMAAKPMVPPKPFEHIKSVKETQGGEGRKCTPIKGDKDDNKRRRISGDEEELTHEEKPVPMSTEKTPVPSRLVREQEEEPLVTPQKNGSPLVDEEKQIRQASPVAMSPHKPELLEEETIVQQHQEDDTTTTLPTPPRPLEEPAVQEQQVAELSEEEARQKALEEEMERRLKSGPELPYEMVLMEAEQLRQEAKKRALDRIQNNAKAEELKAANAMVDEEQQELPAAPPARPETPVKISKEGSLSAAGSPVIAPSSKMVETLKNDEKKRPSSPQSVASAVGASLMKKVSSTGNILRAASFIKKKEPVKQPQPGELAKGRKITIPALQKAKEAKLQMEQKEKDKQQQRMLMQQRRDAKTKQQEESGMPQPPSVQQQDTEEEATATAAPPTSSSSSSSTSYAKILQMKKKTLTTGASSSSTSSPGPKNKEHERAKSLENVWRPENNYEMSDPEEMSSGSECESETDSPKKEIPEWAQRDRLMRSLQEQYYGENRPDPDRIFGEIPACDLELIFKKNKKRYKVRGSSGIWHQDGLTVREVEDYRRDAGLE